MAIEVYWGSGSPFAWRVLLALEYKRLPYVSHLLQFSKQEHKSPQMLALNSRGTRPGAQGRRLRVLRVARDPLLPRSQVSATADLRAHPGGSRHHHAGDLRVPGVHRAAAQRHRARHPVRHERDLGSDEITAAMHAVASEARTIEGRLSKSDWIVGESFSAVDMVIFPGIQLLQRALEKTAGARAGLALHAGGGQLSGPRALARRASPRCPARAHLSAALAGKLKARSARGAVGALKLSRADPIDNLHRSAPHARAARPEKTVQRAS